MCVRDPLSYLRVIVDGSDGYFKVLDTQLNGFWLLF